MTFNFQIMQYLITGGALTGSILVIVACCSAVSYAIKRRKQKNLSPTDISIQAKYLDTSRQISLMQDQRTTTQSDVLTPRQSETQTSQLFCETSFSSPSIGVSEDPLPTSSRSECYLFSTRMPLPLTAVKILNFKSLFSLLEVSLSEII